MLADQAGSNYTDLSAPGNSPLIQAAYLHYTPNETIGGVEFGYVPRHR